MSQHSSFCKPPWEWPEPWDWASAIAVAIVVWFAMILVFR